MYLKSLGDILEKNGVFVCNLTQSRLSFTISHEWCFVFWLTFAIIIRVSARRRWFPEVEQSSYELEEEWKVVGGAGLGEGIQT